MEGLSETATTVILLIVSFGIASGFYVMVNVISAAKPITIEQITGYCENSTAYFVVRNGGNAPLTKSSFVCTKTDSGCSGECVVDKTFPAGGAGYVKIYNCSTGTHKFILKGTSNSLELVVYCR